MSLNATPSGERVHIGIFGRRNAGKSSILNAITSQDLAIVSDTPGTTTDPVSKAMELLPLGPVVITDTPGLDDEGELGELRVGKAYEALRKCKIALIVVDSTVGLTQFEENLIKEAKDRQIAFVLCFNKCDAARDGLIKVSDAIYVSAKTGEGINELKEKLAHVLPSANEKRIVGDLINAGDVIVLVVPIDSAAPKGRLILPQQMTIRDILDEGAIPVVTRETELKETLSKLVAMPKLVITDSQAFKVVNEIVPKDVPLTSFSILMSRYKGEFDWQLEGAKAIETLEDGDIVLISEGCTHHRQCGDIGTQKLPKLVKGYSKKEISFEFTSGGEFPSDLSKYKMIIHCGGCTLNEEEMKYRIKHAIISNVSITNYGMMIAYVNGILERSIQFFN